MANRNGKNMGPRVAVNTALLVLMAVAFGTATLMARGRIAGMALSVRPISDAAHLCFENEIVDEDGKTRITEGSYICSSYPDEDNDNFERVDDLTSHSLFLYDTATLSYRLRSLDLELIVTVLGGMLATASFVGAVVYWNHNRG